LREFGALQIDNLIDRNTMSTHQQTSGFRGRGGADSHKRAVEYFAKKLHDNPSSVRANQGMAALLLREQKVDQAMDHYAAAAMAAPGDIMVRNDYAIALAKTGSKRDGVEVMRSALQMDADNPGLRNNMSALLSRKGTAVVGCECFECCISTGYQPATSVMY
jgi:Tfp pilus assembly protein PilF